MILSPVPSFWILSKQRLRGVKNFSRVEKEVTRALFRVLASLIRCSLHSDDIVLYSSKV